MDTISRAVGRVRRKLWLSGLLVSAVWTLTGMIAAAVVVRLAERVFGLVIDWSLVAMILGGLWVVGAFIGSLLSMPGAMDAARRLDERAGLGERVSTALAVRENDDPWSKAVVSDAGERLSGARGRQAVSAVRVEAPRAWSAPVIALVAGMLVWAAVPELDLSGEIAQREKEAQAEAEFHEVAQKIEAEQEQLAQKLAEAGLGEELKAEEPELPEGADPEALKRERLKQLAALNERIEQQLAGEKGERAKAIQDAMKKLKRPGPGPMDEMSRAMARGDLGQAKAKLEELRKQLEAGELSDEQREALGKQLENMAQQLDKAAADQKEAEKRLAEQMGEQGLSPEQAEKLAKMASDPEALKKALEAMKGLTPEQIQKLVEQAQGSKQAQQMLQKMAQQMQSACKSCQGGQPGQAGESMSGMGQSLSEAEMAQSEAQAMQAAAQMAKSQMQSMSSTMTAEQWAQCFGQGGADGDQPGPSGPGRGSGSGAGPAAQESAFGSNKSQAKVVTGEGPIIGSRYVNESQVIGESRAELAQAVESSGAVASEALENNAVPVEYHESVKRYFGRLAERVESERAAETPAPAPESGSDGE